MSEGKYIYCIINSNDERNFGNMSIGGRGDRVYSICYQDIAAVISDSPVKEYRISRENVLAHQKVMEMLMNDHDILPVKFGTIAGEKDGVKSEERIRNEVLKVRYKELISLLNLIEGKTELGLKALWKDMNVIFQEIVNENREIRKIKRLVTTENPIRARGHKVRVGEMVKNALDEKKSKEKVNILQSLKNNYVDIRCNKVFGDKMVANFAFLVNKEKEKIFDNMVKQLCNQYNGRMQFKYIGPVPPINFVELVIKFERE